jgi:hypothetical protein
MYYNRMKCLDVKAQKDFIVWQVVDADENNSNGQVTCYVNSSGQKIKLPKIYEMVVEAEELESIQ